jgi:hypothetical protein
MKAKRNDAGHWEAVIGKLRMDRAAVTDQEAAAAAEARPLALPASTGDSAAAAKLIQINTRRAELARQVETLDAALEDAAGQLQAAQQAEADARVAVRRGELAAAAAQQVAHAAEVDAAAAALASAMAGYAQNVAAMTRLGLDVTKQRRLTNRTMISGSLHLAGLSGRVPLAPCSPHHRKRLQDWSAQMLGDVLDPAPAAPPPADAMAGAAA